MFAPKHVISPKKINHQLCWMISTAPMVSCLVPQLRGSMLTSPCHFRCAKQPRSSGTMECLPLNDRSIIFNPSNYEPLSRRFVTRGHPSLVEPLSVDPRSKAPCPRSDPSAQVAPSIALRRRQGLFPHADVSYLFGVWGAAEIAGISTGGGLRRRDEATPCLSSLILSSPLSSRYPIQSSSAFINV